MGHGILSKISLKVEIVRQFVMVSGEFVDFLSRELRKAGDAALGVTALELNNLRPGRTSDGHDQIMIDHCNYDLIDLIDHGTARL